MANRFTKSESIGYYVSLWLIVFAIAYGCYHFLGWPGLAVYGLVTINTELEAWRREVFS